jgi:anti-sigma factor RsiW
MDHRYIDDHSVAARYLNQALPAPERAAFEAHLVDCQECTDRLLLAEMFHHRNGNAHRAATPVPELPDPPLSRPHPQATTRPQAKYQPRALRDRFVRLFTSWQIFLILAVAAAVLVLGAFALLLLAIR